MSSEIYIYQAFKRVLGHFGTVDTNEPRPLVSNITPIRPSKNNPLTVDNLDVATVKITVTTEDNTRDQLMLYENIGLIRDNIKNSAFAVSPAENGYTVTLVIKNNRDSEVAIQELEKTVLREKAKRELLRAEPDSQVSAVKWLEKAFPESTISDELQSLRFPSR